MCLLCIEMAKMHIREVASAYSETTMVEDHFDEFLDKIEEQFGEEAKQEFSELVLEIIMRRL